MAKRTPSPPPDELSAGGTQIDPETRKRVEEMKRRGGKRGLGETLKQLQSTGMGALMGLGEGAAGVGTLAVDALADIATAGPARRFFGGQGPQAPTPLTNKLTQAANTAGQYWEQQHGMDPKAMAVGRVTGNVVAPGPEVAMVGKMGKTAKAVDVAEDVSPRPTMWWDLPAEEQQRVLAAEQNMRPTPQLPQPQLPAQQWNGFPVTTELDGRQVLDLTNATDQDLARILESEYDNDYQHGAIDEWYRRGLDDNELEAHLDAAFNNAFERNLAQQHGLAELPDGDDFDREVNGLRTWAAGQDDDLLIHIAAGRETEATPAQIEAARIALLDRYPDREAWNVPPEPQPQPPWQPSTWYYDNIEEGIHSLPQPRATPQQWLAHLTKIRGVKDELKAVPLEAFLQGKQSVSKQEMLDWIAQNKVQVGETVYSDPFQNLTGDAWDKYDSELQGIVAGNNDIELEDYYAWGNETLSVEDLVAKYPALVPDYNTVRSRYGMPEFGSQSNPTQFAGFALPGGKNYTERVFTVPPTPLRERKLSLRPTNAPNDLLPYEVYDETNGQVLYGTYDRHPETALEGARRLYGPIEDNYYAPHFSDVPNNLGHMRTTDRSVPDWGEGVLAEEIQSDLHQAGSKYGYGPEHSEQRAAMMSKLLDERDAALEHYTQLRVNFANQTQLDAARNASHRAQRAVDRFGESKPVPDLPLQGDAWKRMMIRRLIADAVDRGKQWAGWTGGQVQRNRYPGAPHNEGLAKFYDDVLPKIANKDLGQYGVKAEQADMPIGRIGDTRNQDTWEIDRAPDTVPVHRFRITPEMAEAVRTGKLPLWLLMPGLFGLGGAATNPFSTPDVDHTTVDPSAKKYD